MCAKINQIKHLKHLMCNKKLQNYKQQCNKLYLFQTKPKADAFVKKNTILLNVCHCLFSF